MESRLFGLTGFGNWSPHVVVYFVSIFGPLSQTLGGCAGLPQASRPCLPPLLAPTRVLLVPLLSPYFGVVLIKFGLQYPTPGSVICWCP